MKKKAQILRHAGLAGAIVSCLPMMAVGLVALVGAAGAGAAQTSMAGMGGMASVSSAPGILGLLTGLLDPIAQPVLLASLVLLVATSWPRGRGLFGLTALLSVAAYVFMDVLDRSVLSWVALAVLAIVLIRTTVREYRSMACDTAPTVPAAPSDGTSAAHG